MVLIYLYYFMNDAFEYEINNSHTSGISETFFQMQDFKVGLIDVGGQATERRKLLHCFETVSAVLFVVAMSEYDQVLKGDTNKNRMKESLKLFASVCNIRWFQKASMILFLNKKDVFEEKISHNIWIIWQRDNKSASKTRSL